MTGAPAARCSWLRAMRPEGAKAGHNLVNLIQFTFHPPRGANTPTL